MVIRPARPDEAGRLTELALASKAQWGYSEAFLAACRAELTVSAERCAAGSVRVAEEDHVVGFAELAGVPPCMELTLLYVTPDRMAHGVGTTLLDDALEWARVRGATELRLDADPHAEGFYRHQGAVRMGDRPSGSIPGRRLPLLSFDLTGGEPPTSIEV
jgi:GNAT superfamily N-acetyltransferase